MPRPLEVEYLDGLKERTVVVAQDGRKWMCYHFQRRQVWLLLDRQASGRERSSDEVLLDLVGGTAVEPHWIALCDTCGTQRRSLTQGRNRTPANHASELNMGDLKCGTCGTVTRHAFTTPLALSPRNR